MPDLSVDLAPTRWYVWIEDSEGWSRSGPFPEAFAEFYARSNRRAKAYALEAA